MQSYSPTEQGGYKEGLSSYDTYHCWAATQYREKVRIQIQIKYCKKTYPLDQLDAELAGTAWTQSAPPAGVASPGSGSGSPGRPSSAQGLRKSRASARSTTGSTLRSDSASPASFHNSPAGTPDVALDQKAANESFFASMGQLNASRPDHLPPSQGGKYQGFGSTPSPPPLGSQHPAFGLTSAAAPSISDFQENPRAALSKGWSLFSAAVAGASKVVSENVIQPGIEKVSDPNLHASVRGYMTEAQKRATYVGQSANQWSKNQFGVDVAEHVGGVVDGVKERIAGPEKSGYGSLAQENDGESSALYHDDTDDFFTEFSDGHKQEEHHAASTISGAPSVPKKDEWDEWKDF
jgi:ADP-ribosylation factor GTPase-activating protein 1